MEVDRELITGCVSDMKSAVDYIKEINKTFGIPIFIQLVQLNLRISELESILKDV